MQRDDLDTLGDDVVPDDPAAVCFQGQADLREILRRGVLRVGLPNDTTSYFLWRGQVLGFELELLEAFAADLQVELQPHLVQRVEDRLAALRMGEVDAVAGRLAPLDVPGVSYSLPVADGSAMVLQPGLDAKGTCEPLQVLDALDLDGREVWVAPEHGWEEAFSDARSPDAWLVAAPPGTTSEGVAQQVEAGAIPLGLVRDDLAGLLAGDETLVEGPALEAVDVTAHVGFAAASPALRDRFDAWLLDNQDLLFDLHRRYFEDRESHRLRVDEPTFTLHSGRLSDFDQLFREHAGDPWPDWALLAAQAYQESSFRPRARSWAGARGLMQIMPRTARQLGVRDPYDPEQAVPGAVRYLLWLDGLWRDAGIDDDALREKFVLASYNAGLGHLEDARRVAEADGGDPNDWADIERALLLLEQPAWYRSPHARYGYVRGTEPVDYVREILVRANHYRAIGNRPEVAVGWGAPKVLR